MLLCKENPSREESPNLSCVALSVRFPPSSVYSDKGGCHSPERISTWDECAPDLLRGELPLCAMRAAAAARRRPFRF